jgi:hypothetical protein
MMAEPCYGIYEVYLPLAATKLTRVPVKAVVSAGVTSRHPEDSGQDFHLDEGGQIRLPSVDRGTQWCFDVQDVYDSDFRSGLGGPEPGQRVQVFDCLSSQLNQRWNLPGDIVSGGKCLALAGDATNNGAPAIVSTCNDSDVQDWDYYW